MRYSKSQVSALSDANFKAYYTSYVAYCKSLSASPEKMEAERSYAAMLQQELSLRRERHKQKAQTVALRQSAQTIEPCSQEIAIPVGRAAVLAQPKAEAYVQLARPVRAVKQTRPTRQTHPKQTVQATSQKPVSTVSLILWLVFFAPVGLYLLIFKTKLHPTIKTIIAVPFSLWTVLLFYSASLPPPDDSVQQSNSTQTISQTLPAASPPTINEAVALKMQQAIAVAANIPVFEATPEPEPPASRAPVVDETQQTPGDTPAKLPQVESTASPPPEPTPVVQPQPPAQSTVVYITNSGQKYHRAGCRHLKSKIEISLENAQAQGYTPCKTCH